VVGNYYGKPYLLTYKADLLQLELSDSSGIDMHATYDRRNHAMNATLQDQRYINKAAAAKYLGISERCLSSWIRDHGLPSIKIGRSRRLDREAIDKWMASQQSATDSQ
jgi:excisionase family DNA binding protein